MTDTERKLIRCAGQVFAAYARHAKWVGTGTVNQEKAVKNLDQQLANWQELVSTLEKRDSNVV